MLWTLSWRLHDGGLVVSRRWRWFGFQSLLFFSIFEWLIFLCFCWCWYFRLYWHDMATTFTCWLSSSASKIILCTSILRSISAYWINGEDWAYSMLSLTCSFPYLVARDPGNSTRMEGGWAKVGHDVWICQGHSQHEGDSGIAGASLYWVPLRSVSSQVRPPQVFFLCRSNAGGFWLLF